MPIVFGRIAISKEEYDASPPHFILDLTAAMKIRADIEREQIKRAIEEAKRNQ
jgi:hypothetical protein